MDSNSPAILSLPSSPLLSIPLLLEAALALDALPAQVS